MAGEGVLTPHQVEVYPNLLPHGDMESLAGVPPIPTLWTNVLLDPGDTVAEAAIIHSGAQSLEWAVGAIGGEYIERQITLADDLYFAFLAWSVGNGADALRLISTNAALQYSLAANTHIMDDAANWILSQDVRRATAANPTLIINPESTTPAGIRYLDDAGAIALDPITLTVTPRTYANSLETITAIQGLSIDGFDLCTQPVDRITATRGRFRFRVLFRHDPADWFDFGQALCPIVYQWENANNYIYLAITAADTITLTYNAQGAGAVTGNWTPTGLAANTWYSFQVIYTAGYCQLRVDNVTVINLAGFAFAANPSVAVDWGNRYDNVFQLDGNLAPP